MTSKFDSSIPAELAALLTRIRAAPLEESNRILTAFLASLVHPDFVCSLSSLADLSESDRVLVTSIFNRHIMTDRDIEFDSALYTVLLPYLLLPPV